MLSAKFKDRLRYMSTESGQGDDVLKDLGTTPPVRLTRERSTTSMLVNLV